MGAFMNLNTQTLVFILSLSLLAQVIALFVQYRVVNRSYRGIGLWLLGSSFMALGFVFMPLVRVDSLLFLAMIANPLMALGQILLYLGIVQFLNKKEHRWMLSLFFSVFLLAYYHFMFVFNDISGRTIVVNIALAIISFLTAYTLLLEKRKFTSTSVKFSVLIFILYGAFLAIRVLWTMNMPRLQNYSDFTFFLNAGFIVTTVASTLWTYGFILMVNQHLNEENRLEKEKMQLVFNTSPDASLITRLSDGLVVDVNTGFVSLSGYTREEVFGTTTVQINVWSSLEDRQQFFAKLDEQGFCENMEFAFQRKDGSQFNGMISARIITIQNVSHVISVVRDISERKRTEEALIESEEQYRSILNASPDDITITDLEGRILMISPAAKEMFGYELDFDSFIGMQLLDFILPEDVERARSNILRMYQGNNNKPNEYRGIRKDKSIFDIEVNSGFVRNANGQPIRMVFIVRDITERKRAELHIQELVQQLEAERNIAQVNSITDSLTGLANRRYFDLALNTEFYRVKRTGETMSLIMIDVDHFKKFNDSYGHLAGDDCLVKIGSMLKSIIGRAPDIVARYGGEEFVVILPETESYGAKALAERIRKGVEVLGIPHVSSETAAYVTISLGVVSVNTTYMISPKQIVAMADEALYFAKSLGRNRTIVSDNQVTVKIEQ